MALSVHKPANVALYVAVNQDGRGVTYLTAQNFRVYENGVILDNAQVELRLLPASAVTARRVALLVDMSRMLDDEQRTQLLNGLAAFVGKLRHRQPVSRFAFDGSTSLYSAIVDAATKLDRAVASEKQPLQRGTLIVIAQNPDLAGRVSQPDARKFVQESPHQYFLLTVGKWATETDVSWLGKTQALRAASFNTVTSPLDQIAESVENDYFRYYVVFYCSPARTGTRQVTLEVTITNDKGQKQSANYSTVFEAKDFGPNCQSNTPPTFSRISRLEVETIKQN